MKKLFKFFTATAVVATLAMAWPTNLRAAHPLVITNNDLKGASSVSGFKFTGTTLQGPLSFATGGTGIGGGFSGLDRIALFLSNTDKCVFASDAGTGDIASFQVAGKNAVKIGNYKDASGSGKAHGIGLAVSGKFLFAAYTTTKNIGVWNIRTGCKLKLAGTDKAAGAVSGMRAALNGKTLVVSYGSGMKKVDSFSIGATGKLTEHGPYSASAALAGVDITQDSAYAIFGVTTSGKTQVEIYPIHANGSLGAGTSHGGNGTLGAGLGSSNVWLSVDEKFLFVSNDFSKQITSLGFAEKPLSLSYINITTVTDPSNQITSVARVETVNATGNGGFVVLAEDASPASFVGLFQINADGSTTEVSGSPFPVGQGPGLKSLVVGPGRPF
jgi:hypothetical protein